MEQYQNFKLSVYCNVHDVMSMPGDYQDFLQDIAFFQKHLKLSKVYIETYRGDTVDSAKLLQVKDFFNRAGIETATGITNINIKTGKGNISETMCYTDAEQLEDLERLFKRMATEFNEIMIDDFLSTSCTCETCREAKGKRTWEQFRLDKMTEVCRDRMIAPARAANPKVKITIKYPTWMHSFQRLGYNTETQPFLFDETYSGTETRHTTYSFFRNPRYTSYSLIRWLQSCPPHNNRGGWFDPYLCHNPLNSYIEQAYLTLFAKPEEMTLYCYNILKDTKFIPLLGHELTQIDKFLGALGKPTGVKTYIPYHSDGEGNVYDFLGMCGVPCDPVAIFPEESCTVLLTASSATDKDVLSRVKKHLLAGNDVAFTAGFVRLMQDKGLEEFNAMRLPGTAMRSNYFGAFEGCWDAAVRYNYSGKEIGMPVADWKLNDCDYKAAMFTESMPNPLVTYNKYGNGRAYFINIPDDYADLYWLPDTVLDKYRMHLSRALPVRIEGQAKVALFPYDNNTFVLQNFLEHGTVVRVYIKGDVKELARLNGGENVKRLYQVSGESVFELAVLPGCHVPLAWR
ncbi:MAG: hypothetical protein ACOYJX_03280 [Acutalibacteraceae bacterium]|jgi:hypothetical protein